jgi:hypothetical protein
MSKYNQCYIYNIDINKFIIKQNKQIFPNTKKSKKKKIISHQNQKF